MVILVCQISLIIRSAWNTITCSTITIKKHTGSKRLQKISLTNEQKAKFQLCMRVCFWITGGLVCHLKGHKNSDLRSMSIIPNMQKLHFPKTLFQVELFYEIYWLNWLRLYAIPETVGCFISSSWQTYRFVYQFLNFLTLQGQQNWEELNRAPEIDNSDIKSI